MDSFYSVSYVAPETGCWVMSRLFTKLAAARKWAQWCSRLGEAKIHRGGPGAELVAHYPKA